MKKKSVKKPQGQSLTKFENFKFSDTETVKYKNPNNGGISEYV